MPTFITEAFDIWLRELEPTLTRYAIFTVGVWLLLWMVLKPLIAARKIRSDSPPARQLVSEFLFSLRSMAIFASVGVVITFMYRADLYPLADVAKSWGPVWFVISVVAGVIGLDTWFYWSHRLMHDPRLFRRFHRRHHRSNNPSPFTAYSFDVGEALLLSGFSVVWPFIFPMAPYAMAYVLLYQIVTNTLVHSGYELMPARRDGRPLLDFVVTTTHHDLHHAHAGWNYAGWFTWWDRWCGTEHPEYRQRFAAKAWKPFGQPALAAAE